MQCTACFAIDRRMKMERYCCTYHIKPMLNWIHVAKPFMTYRLSITNPEMTWRVDDQLTTSFIGWQQFQSTKTNHFQIILWLWIPVDTIEQSVKFVPIRY